jgi:hypothetical protein
MNYDGNTRDAFYRAAPISQITPPDTSGRGLNGLFLSDKTNPNSYEARQGVMVWSLGPDGAASTTEAANKGLNADNVTSWGAK